MTPGNARLQQVGWKEKDQKWGWGLEADALLAGKLRPPGAWGAGGGGAGLPGPLDALGRGWGNLPQPGICNLTGLVWHPKGKGERSEMNSVF